MKPQIFCAAACTLALTILPLSAATSTNAAPAVPPAQAPTAAVARVNGVEITRAQLDEAIQDVMGAMGQPVQSLPDDKRKEAEKHVLDQLIDQQLVLAKSKSIKIDNLDSKIKDELAQVKKQFPDEKMFNEKLKELNLTEDKLKQKITDGLQMEALVDQEVKNKIQISTNEIKEFYDSHPQYFSHPPQIRASHILVLVPKDADDKVKAEKKAIIEKARERVIKGEDFAKVASEVSEDPGSKSKGGDLDYFSKGTMVKPFEDAAFALKSNEVSEVVTTAYGYHVIKQTGDRPASVTPMEEEQERIESFLKKQKLEQGMMAYVETLKKDAKIEVLLQ